MSITRITLQRFFVADHFHDLPGFREARHGHNWEAQVSVDRDDGNTDDLFSKALDEWISAIDYQLLNEQPFMEGRNPTAEVLAEQLLRYLQGRDFRAVEVKIREKRNYWAACMENRR